MEHQIRPSIQKWSLIGDMKAYYLIRLREQMPSQLFELGTVIGEYHDVPIGPTDTEVVQRMTEKELERWHRGNVMVYYTNISLFNLFGIFVSELFFALEAMCRAICSCACLQYAIEAADSNVIIQHQQVHKTLKMLAQGGGQGVNCKLCSIRQECRISACLSIAAVYELFYHIRVIKDYRLEFYYNNDWLPFMTNEYVDKGFQALCTVSEIQSRLMKGYLENPLPVSTLERIVATHKALNNSDE